MASLYWVLEYIRVLFGYLFLMFLWPGVVFGRHFKGKSFTYRFAFCVTVQPVLVSTVVLCLGLFHVLNRPLIVVLFYGVFLLMLFFQTGKYAISVVREADGQEDIVQFAGKRLNGDVQNLFMRVRQNLFVNVLLVLVLIFGVIYFSYGSSQLHGYGYGDLYVHHSWIYGLIEGKIFSGGVYPEAMHCFIYCLHALFGISVSSILPYLQCVHVAVLLLSAYCLLREVFRWRYMPLLALVFYLTVDVVGRDMIYSISRLQWTLPLEFGLHTQFLCALFLIRYLKDTRSDKGKDANLFLFVMSLAASIAIHYYTTIMAFLVCISFAVFAWRKVFSRKYFLPLCLAVLCGCLVAVTPMIGALASGIPFNYSINWAVNSMSGDITRESQMQQGGQTKQKGQEEIPEERETVSLRKYVFLFGEKLKGIYQYGYVRLYGERRAAGILILTGAAVLAEAVRQWRQRKAPKGQEVGYAPVVMISVLFIVTYAMPYVGLPELISDARFCSTGHIMIIAAALAPFDAVLSGLSVFWGNMVQRGIFVLSMAGVYAAAFLTGSYRGYLFQEVSRYDAAVLTTNSIIATFPKDSFVIISPTDELYPVVEHGGHEELLTFVRNRGDAEYTVPQENVFIFVEKKPLLYAQAHFFDGPSWLAQEKYMEIYQQYNSHVSQGEELLNSEISGDAAGRDIADTTGDWAAYTQLDTRTILESKAYEWCRRFGQSHPGEMYVYYEDEFFVCYYFAQDINAPYKLGEI